MRLGRPFHPTATLAVLLCAGIAYHNGAIGPVVLMAADKPTEAARHASGKSDARGVAAGLPEFPKDVSPFLNTYCVSCHGPTKSKGKITLHDINGDLAAGRDLVRWEKVLQELRSGEMPPEDKEQPKDATRQAFIAWIESGIRTFASSPDLAPAVPTARRLTNFEYQNTMRDLLGFEWKLLNGLPEDPEKQYRFNNTSRVLVDRP